MMKSDMSWGNDKYVIWHLSFSEETFIRLAGILQIRRGPG
jgi:hypothetical protein